MPIHDLKTRFCPSPTGQMHLGNIRTALFSFLFARNQSGKFLLRIEDSDKVRSKSEFVDLLKADLNWLGLSWNEGPYFQSERADIYNKYYSILEKNNLVYPCFCSDEHLALSRKIQLSSGKPPRYAGTCRDLSPDEIQNKINLNIKYTLRFKVPKNQKIIFQDLIKGEQSFDSNDIGDFIIQRADKSASFFFCNAIDDSLMGVTHAIRGEDHLTNTPRQLLILSALDLPSIQYGHLPLILSPEGDKLSKREGSENLDSLRHKGYLPIAINNYLSRLGHYYEINNLLSLDDLAKHFSISHIGRTPAHFDESHLNFWQKQAVMLLTHQEFLSWIQPELNKINFNFNLDSNIDNLINLIKPNILFPEEFINWLNILYQPIIFNADAKNILKNIDQNFYELFSSLITADKNYAEITRELSEQLNIKGKNLFQPLRIILTGQLHGPELLNIFNLLGKKIILEKIQQARVTA